RFAKGRRSDEARGGLGRRVGKAMKPKPRHLLQVEHVGDVTVVRFTDGKFNDEEDSQAMADQLSALVNDPGRRNLLLDFANVEYVTSAALGKFVALHKELQKVGGSLAFRNMITQVYKIFEVTKLHKIFKIQRAEGGDDP